MEGDKHDGDFLPHEHNFGRARTGIVDNRTPATSAPPYILGNDMDAAVNSTKSADGDNDCSNERIRFSLSDGDQMLPAPPYKDAHHINVGNGNTTSKVDAIVNKLAEESIKSSELNALEVIDPVYHAPVKIQSLGTRSFFNQSKREFQSNHQLEDSSDDGDDSLGEAVSEPNSSIREIYDAFHVEDEGTPGYQALQANADVEVSKLRKFTRKIKLPTFTRTMEKAKKAFPKTHKGQKAPFVPPSIIVSDDEIEAKVKDGKMRSYCKQQKYHNHTNALHSSNYAFTFVAISIADHELKFRSTWEHINERWSTKNPSKSRQDTSRQSYVKGRVSKLKIKQ